MLMGLSCFGKDEADDSSASRMSLTLHRGRWSEVFLMRTFCQESLADGFFFLKMDFSLDFSGTTFKNHSPGSFPS